MKQKLLSILALLLMTATGAWAGTETIATNQGQGSYTGTNITISVTADAGDEDGCILNGPDGMTISTKNGDVITQMVLTIGWYSNQAGNVTASSGTRSVSGSGNGSTYVTITGINASSVTIGSAYVWLQVSQVQVTYESTVNVTANEGATGEYWSTYYNAAQGFKADANTKVFKAALTGNQLTMTEVANREIPAGKAVILKSSSSSITLTPATTTETLEGNQLQGTATELTNPGNAYVLNKKNGVVGFYKLSSTGTIGANKAYLIYDGATAREFFSIEGNVTGIEMPKAATTNNDDEVYDLQGRRVANPTKGLYIVNGKKVFINK